MSERVKPKSGSARLVVGAIAAILLLLLVARIMSGPHPNPHVLKHEQCNAGRLRAAIELYQALLNALPAEAMYSASTDADGAYENVEVVKQVNGILERDPNLRLEKRELNDAGSFIDRWGQPYRVVMWKESPTDRVASCFQVYSCGPNQKWEQGAGDDIGAR